MVRAESVYTQKIALLYEVRHYSIPKFSCFKPLIILVCIIVPQTPKETNHEITTKRYTFSLVFELKSVINNFNFFSVS